MLGFGVFQVRAWHTYVGGLGSRLGRGTSVCKSKQLVDGARKDSPPPRYFTLADYVNSVGIVFAHGCIFRQVAKGNPLPRDLDSISSLCLFANLMKGLIVEPRTSDCDRLGEPHGSRTHNLLSSRLGVLTLSDQARIGVF